MTTVTFGFKAFDPHELLCHFIAVEAGLYRRNKLFVELRDITFTPETELPRDWFQVSCGAALASAVKGIPQRVVFVATDKPMFWLYSAGNIKSLEDLKQKKLATFPPVAPPHHLANIILNGSGISVGEELALLAVRDDMARAGLLKSGDADAAVISSAIAPAKMQQLGFNNLCFFGDELRLPTTGLAIDQSFVGKEPALVQTLTGILKESLNLIHNDIEMVGRVLEKYFDMPAEYRNATAGLYQNYYTERGQTTEDIAQTAVNNMSRSLNIDNPIHWRDIYRF